MAAAGTTTMIGDSRERDMKLARVALLALVMLGAAGCVLEEHRDGGVTIRPVH